RVAGAQDTGTHPRLHLRRQVQQPESVGDVRSRAAQPLGELAVRGPEVVQELLVGSGLLQRVELLALEVLQERVPEQFVVTRAPDDRGYALETGLLAGPPPALPHDEL